MTSNEQGDAASAVEVDAPSSFALPPSVVIECMRRRAEQQFEDSIKSQRKRDYYLGYDDALDDVEAALASKPKARP